MTPHESAYEWGINARPPFRRGPFKEMRMTDDEKLLYVLRKAKGVGRIYADRAADRIEALTAERDRADGLRATTQDQFDRAIQQRDEFMAERDAALAEVAIHVEGRAYFHQQIAELSAEVERLNFEGYGAEVQADKAAVEIARLTRKARKWKRRARMADVDAAAAEQYALSCVKLSNQSRDERDAAHDEALEEAAVLVGPSDLTMAARIRALKRPRSGSERAQETARDILTDMVQCEVDYMTINNLGDPEKQYNIKRARAIGIKSHRSGSERAQEADTQLLCAGGCGRPYSDGPDVLIPDEAWLKIAPRPDGGGVLCPNCMDDRLRAAGYDYGEAPGFFMSGPMCSNDLPFRLTGHDGKRMWTAQPSTERAAGADTTPPPAVGGAEPACEHSWLCRDGKTWECDWCGMRRADSAEPEKVASGPNPGTDVIAQAEWIAEGSECHMRFGGVPCGPLCECFKQAQAEVVAWLDRTKIDQPHKPLATDQWPACEVCRQPLIPDAYVQTGVHRAKHAGCCTVDVKSQDAGRADTSGQDREAAHRPVDGVAGREF